MTDNRSALEQSVIKRELSPNRLPYTAPILSDLGDIRDVTLAGSPGAGDSITSQQNVGRRRRRDFRL